MGLTWVLEGSLLDLFSTQNLRDVVELKSAKEGCFYSYPHTTLKRC